MQICRNYSLGSHKIWLVIKSNLAEMIRVSRRESIGAFFTIQLNRRNQLNKHHGHRLIHCDYTKYNINIRVFTTSYSRHLIEYSNCMF